MPTTLIADVLCNYYWLAIFSSDYLSAIRSFYLSSITVALSFSSVLLLPLLLKLSLSISLLNLGISQNLHFYWVWEFLKS